MQFNKFRTLNTAALIIFFIFSNSLVSWASKTLIYETFDKNIKIGTATLIIIDINE